MAYKRKRSGGGRRPKRPRLYRKKRKWSSYKKRVKSALFGIAETKRYQSPFVDPYYLGSINQPERKQMVTCGLLQTLVQGDKSFQREGSSVFLRGIKFTLGIGGALANSHRHRIVLFWHNSRFDTRSVTGTPELRYNAFPSFLLGGFNNDTYNHFYVPYDPKRVKIVKSWNFMTYAQPAAEAKQNKLFKRYVKLSRKIQYDEDDSSAESIYTKGWQLYLGYIWDGPDAETSDVGFQYTLYYKDF